MVFEAPDLNVEWYTKFIAVIQNAVWCHHVICDETGATMLSVMREKKRATTQTLAAQKKSYNKPRQCIKKQRHYFANKGLYGQSYGFSSSHVQM